MEARILRYTLKQELIAVALFALISLSSVIVYAAEYKHTNYDIIVNDPSWPALIAQVEKHIVSNQFVIGYLRHVVNEKDLKQLAQSGELDADKSKFVLENSEGFLKYIYYVIVMNQILKFNPAPTDSQYIYITGVINDPRAQAATNGPEYEMEKDVFRQVQLYALWEVLHSDGALKGLVNENLDMFKKTIQSMS